MYERSQHKCEVFTTLHLTALIRINAVEVTASNSAPPYHRYICAVSKGNY